MQLRAEKFYSCVFKETITILQLAKAFLNFHYHQKENISKIILEMYDLKRSKKLLSSTEDRPIFEDLEGSRPRPRPRS